MPALSNHVLSARLRAALPTDTAIIGDGAKLHPLHIRAKSLGEWLIYLWTVTPDRSAKGRRPKDEYKIQLMFSKSAAAAHRRNTTSTRRPRYLLRFAADAHTALLGYSPEFGVFVGWEARRYSDFGKSPNAQVREGLLEEAREHGWAVAEPRRVKGGTEVRVAFSPPHLSRFLKATAEADAAARVGVERELYMLAAAPLPRDARAAPIAEATTDDESTERMVLRERRRVATTRLDRDPKFAIEVRAAYGSRCAVCDVQLKVVEAAHIVAVNEPKGADKVWNGIALCPTHHKLFDARAFLIRGDTSLSVAPELVSFLGEIDQDGGIEVLLQLEGRRMRKPSFWKKKASRMAMLAALRHRELIAGF
jgi:putative restriction endonuclease